MDRDQRLWDIEKKLFNKGEISKEDAMWLASEVRRLDKLLAEGGELDHSEKH